MAEEPEDQAQDRESKSLTKKIPTGFTIYPLYSKLSLEEQQKIFEHSDPENRAIVVATNIAETSLTISNIKYVIDPGKEKRKEYNNHNKIGKYVVGWVSQSSANQRKGRAGRTQNGYCYRLFSRAVFENQCAKFSAPEILQQPLEMSVLKLKAIGIRDIEKFPFVTQPPIQSIKDAIDELLYLKAIESLAQSDTGQRQLSKENITDLGRVLSYLPIQPKYGKLLLLARSVGHMEYGILLVASICCDHIYSKRELKKYFEEMERKKKAAAKE